MNKFRVFSILVGDDVMYNVLILFCICLIENEEWVDMKGR